MGNTIDMAGMVFGRLAVKAPAGSDSNGNARWECLCECGTVRIVRGFTLRNGATTSCGCANREIVSALSTKHGLSHTPGYKNWAAMIGRCENKNAHNFARYGGRGIKVCDRWKSYENFLADMGPAPIGMTIDRIDSNGDYTPGNCRWSTPTE